MTDCWVLVQDTHGLRAGETVTAVAMVGDVPGHVDGVGEIIATRASVVGTAFRLDSTDEMEPAGCWWRIVAPGGYVWDVSTPVSQAGTEEAPTLVGVLPRRVPGSPPQSWTPVPDGGTDGDVLGHVGGVPAWTAPSGAVDSVNAKTGVVVLDATDVGAVDVDRVGLEPGQTNRGAWNAGTAYEPGDVVGIDVGYGSVAFVALVPSTGVNPTSDSSKWQVTTKAVQLGAGAVADDGAAGQPGSTSVGAGALGVGAMTTAVGTSASALADWATGVGTMAYADGDGAVSIGVLSSAGGETAVAVGYFASAPNDGDVNLANILIGGIDPGTSASNRAVALPYGALDLPTSVDATNPVSGATRLVGRADGIYVRDSTGVEVGPVADGNVSSSTVATIWTGTDAAYAAIGTKDPATLYVVTP